MKCNIKNLMKEEMKMSELKGKIDFTLFVSVKNANPNGDPLKWLW